MTTADASPRHPLAVLVGASRPEWGRLALAILLGSLAVGCAVGLLAVSAWLISEASLRPPILTLEVAFVAVRALGLGRGVFRYSERLVGHDAAFRSLSRLRVRVYERLADLGPAGVPGFRRGDLLTRLVADVDASQDLPLRVGIPAATALIVGTASALLAAWLLPAAGAIVAASLLLAGLAVPWLATVAGRHAERRSSQARGRLSTEVVDVIVGAGDLLVFGAVDRAVAAASSADDELTGLRARSARASGAAAALAVLAVGAAVVASLVVAVPAVLDGRMSGTLVAVVALLPLAAAEAVIAMPSVALSLAGVRESARRVTEVMDAPLVVHQPARPRALPAGPGRIVLRDVSARWPGSGSEWALRGIDLDLAPGSRVAVVGPSGAGKSTLAAVLLRFLDHEGFVTLDGTDVRELADDDVRAVITAMTQDAHIFDTTVAENLLLANRTATEDGLRDVLGRVGLARWLSGLPAGLATPLGAHGSGMSGGEAQRLALARVLVADRPVVVLDEPTEHLDTASADALTADLLALTEGRTTVFVTHRLVGLEQVDEVVYLEEGRIVERGRHADLLALGGRYARAAGATVAHGEEDQG